MEKECLLVYASLSGNTEMIAEAIAEGVREAGGEPVLKEMYMVDAAELENYDSIAIGSCTWGDGDIPDEGLDFYDELDQVNLSGKKAVTFGSCDSCYDEYGGAVDQFEQKLKDRGADLIDIGLKIELSPSEQELEVCRALGRKLMTSLT